MFDFDLTDDFRKVLGKLSKKNPVISRAVNRKIKEIISRDSLDSYKNLMHDLKHLKRVHITEWLVMTFEVKENFVLFISLSSRDDVYKK